MEANAPTDDGQRSPLAEATERIGEMEGLDTVASVVGKDVRKIFGQGYVKDILSGAHLGHALHPLLTDVPIGAWTSATILDLIGGEDSQDAARRLLGVGILAAFPTLWSGWSDWSDEEERNPAVRRIGLVHAASNGTALGLYAASWLARRRGQRGRGVVIGLVAGGVLGVGGYLGGHLTYAEGAGAGERRPGGSA